MSGVLAALAFLPITLVMMDDLSYKEGVSDLLRAGADPPTAIKLWFCTLVGVGVTAGLFAITDYYTSTRFRPVRTTARALADGHATNIIQGSPRASSPRRPRRSCSSAASCSPTSWPGSTASASR